MIFVHRQQATQSRGARVAWSFIEAPSEVLFNSEFNDPPERIAETVVVIVLAIDKGRVLIEKIGYP